MCPLLSVKTEKSRGQKQSGTSRGMFWVFSNGFSYFWIFSNENISCRGAETMFYIFQFIACSIWPTEAHSVDAESCLIEQCECWASRKSWSQLLLEAGCRSIYQWGRTEDQDVTRWGTLECEVETPVWNSCLCPSPSVVTNGPLGSGIMSETAAQSWVMGHWSQYNQKEMQTF